MNDFQFRTEAKAFVITDDNVHQSTIYENPSPFTCTVIAVSND